MVCASRALSAFRRHNQTSDQELHAAQGGGKGSGMGFGLAVRTAAAAVPRAAGEGDGTQPIWRRVGKPSNAAVGAGQNFVTARRIVVYEVRLQTAKTMPTGQTMENVKDDAMLLMRARELQADVAVRPWNHVFGNCAELFATAGSNERMGILLETGRASDA